ncbi:hypothetical protein F5B20DRAFT_575978 [Whalleya microplaca]|nr:hypothetical protein F5B20DRAFT_575978 [Whalleya microplaca]
MPSAFDSAKAKFDYLALSHLVMFKMDIDTIDGFIEKVKDNKTSLNNLLAGADDKEKGEIKEMVSELDRFKWLAETDVSNKKKLMKELEESDPKNVMASAYVSLLGNADSGYRKIYGPHYDTLLALKIKYDLGSMFKYTVPWLFI